MDKADQISGADDPNLRALLQGLGTGSGAGALVESLLGQAKVSPQVSLLAGMLLEGMNESGFDDDDDDEAELSRLLGLKVPDSSGQRDPVDEEDGQEQELETLREVNDTVAAALGACPNCWGGAPTCATCGGAGGAGAMEIDEGLFNELVLPAVKRLRADRRVRSKAE